MEKLLFWGYASRDLDAVEIRFREKHGREPDAFVIQPGYTVYGSRRNHERLIESRYGGYAAIYVPLTIDRETIINLESEYMLKRSAPPEEIPEEEIGLEERIFMDERIRYCVICGQIFEADIESKIIHCGKPACEQRVYEIIHAREEIKEVFGKTSGGGRRPTAWVEIPDSESDEIAPQTIPEKATQPKALIDDNFSLDDPYTHRIEGWVYLIESDNGLYKLGRSDNVQSRFNNLATENAAHLTLRHAIIAKDYVRTESWLHKRFATKRHHGEWFRLLDDDIAWFCELDHGALDGV